MIVHQRQITLSDIAMHPASRVQTVPKGIMRSRVFSTVEQTPKRRNVDAEDPFGEIG